MPESKKPDMARQYFIITGNYWGFTITDGALRMLVLLYFHQLGYGPLDIAFLFLFYEIFGVITNLVGGWLGARWGLNRTMNMGLALQIIALSMLLVPESYLSIIWVMAAQALSGIAKDLNKMSAKSGIKLLVPDNQQQQLYRWVSLLTGSKNALKGVGFFLGGLLLNLWGFHGAIMAMVILLIIIGSISLIFLKSDLGKSSYKAKFSQLFSNNRQINGLAAARLCLFSARDVWFVIALPVYFSTTLNWSHWQVGGFFALWIIGYGLIQALAPKISRQQSPQALIKWSMVLALLPIGIGLLLLGEQYISHILVIGLLLFGAVFAINSALHSYLIVSYAKRDGVSLDVGFYYMANAMGRLLGTVLSGLLFQYYGLISCLLASTVLIVLATALSLRLNTQENQ